MNAYSDTELPVVEVTDVISGALAWAEFVEGMNAAIRGADLAEMTTENERDGWWYARQCVAAKASDFGEDWIEEDYSWIAGGC